VKMSVASFKKIVEDFREKNLQQRELLTNLYESWCADRERHHHETIEATFTVYVARVLCAVKTQTLGVFTR